MHSQQLQHADEVPGARQRAVTRFKTLSQLSKRRRQTPVAVDGRVIEIGWFHFQRGQVVQRIEQLLALAIRAIMPGHEHSVADDFDAIDVCFDRDRGEGMPPRHAVAILLPGDCLVLVDLADFADRGFERAIRQRQGTGPLPGEAAPIVSLWPAIVRSLSRWQQSSRKRRALPDPSLVGRASPTGAQAASPGSRRAAFRYRGPASRIAVRRYSNSPAPASAGSTPVVCHAGSWSRPSSDYPTYAPNPVMCRFVLSLANSRWFWRSCLEPGNIIAAT